MIFLPSLSQHGFAVLSNVLSEAEVQALRHAIQAASAEQAATGKAGVRNLLHRIPAIRALAESAPIRGLVEPVLGAKALVVRGILFDKTPETNWKVPWHQDLTIAVARKVEVPGFGPWTVKDGVQHVQPPQEILEKMLAVRIHLDDCEEENGPLRVIEGSHLHGRLAAEQIDAMQATTACRLCTVGLGGVVLMRPLLLHSSSAASSPNHRRVIHLEYAASHLPGGLSWHACQ